MQATPKCWNTSAITLLPKDPSKSSVSDCRPIALTQMLRRVFERVLLASWAPQPWARLCPNQAGFRKHQSAVHQAIVSDESCRLGSKHQAFLDLRGAYDHVPLQHLQALLATRRAPSQAQALFYTLFCRQLSTVVVVNGARTAPIQVLRGLFQGSILSPFLFNIFIDPLATMLAEIQDPDTSLPTALLFADDIKCQHSKLPSLQLQLDVCSGWADANFMQFNLAKCGTLGIPSEHSLRLQGRFLTPVTSYKYLGFPHESRGINWAQHIEKMCSKAQGTLRFSMLRGKGWPMWVKITIFKTFVRPITSYGLAPMALWLDRQPVGLRSKLYNLLDALHLDSLQWILGDKAKNTPRGILESITALPNPARLMGEAAATFNRQLTQLPPDHLWRQVARKYLPHGPWPVTALLPRLQAPQQLVLQYEQCCRDAAAAAPPLPTPSWTTWLQQNRIQELQEPTSPSRGQTTGHRPLGKLRHRSVLCNYIAPAARQARAGFDRILLAEPFSLARTAINWRLNRFSPSLRCINCQKPFTRAHISRCNTLDPNPRFQTFKAMAEARSAALQSTGFKVGALNVMDEMLNQQDYGSFLAAWELSTTTSKPGAQQQPQNSIAASLRDPLGTPGHLGHPENHRTRHSDASEHPPPPTRRIPRPRPLTGALPGPSGRTRLIQKYPEQRVFLNCRPLSLWIRLANCPAARQRRSDRPPQSPLYLYVVL